MGLCDEERIRGIFYAVRGMSEVEVRGAPAVRKAQKRLWPALLSKVGSSGYWFLGSELEADHFKSPTLTSTMLRSSLEQLLPEDPYSELDPERRQKITDDRWWREQFSLEELARSAAAAYDVPLQPLVNLWHWVEQFWYYTNRYDDEISRRFASVSNAVAILQGALFQELHKRPALAKAWLAHAVLQFLVAYGEESVVTAWMREVNLHHKRNVFGADPQWLLGRYRDVLEKPEKTEEPLWQFETVLGMMPLGEHADQDLGVFRFAHLQKKPAFAALHEAIGTKLLGHIAVAAAVDAGRRNAQGARSFNQYEEDVTRTAVGYSE